MLERIDRFAEQFVRLAPQVFKAAHAPIQVLPVGRRQRALRFLGHQPLPLCEAFVRLPACAAGSSACGQSLVAIRAVLCRRRPASRTRRLLSATTAGTGWPQAAVKGSISAGCPARRGSGSAGMMSSLTAGALQGLSGTAKLMLGTAMPPLYARGWNSPNVRFPPDPDIAM